MILLSRRDGEELVTSPERPMSASPAALANAMRLSGPIAVKERMKELEALIKALLESIKLFPSVPGEQHCRRVVRLRSLSSVRFAARLRLGLLV